MSRAKTYAVCTHCGTAGLAWLRVRNARYVLAHAYGKPWAWILYDAARIPSTGEIMEDGAGKAVAKTDAPHSCADYAPLAAWMTGARTLPPDNYTSKAPRKPRAPQAVPQGTGSLLLPPPTAQDEPQDDDSEPEPDEDEGDDDMTQDTKTPPPPAQADAAALIAQALALVQAAGARTVDEDKVRQIVAEAVAGLKPQTVGHTLTVTLQAPEGDRTTLDKEPTHPLFARLLRLIESRQDGHRHNVMLWGAPGGGKSYAAHQAARALGLEYGYISLMPATPESRVIGFTDAQGRIVDTSFRRLYSTGGVFLCDEIDNASDAMLTALNGALENGHAAFPDGLVARHPDFVFLATANTAGRGGSLNHAGRRPLDSATIERFIYVEWTYDAELERTLTLRANADAAPWLAWVGAVRDFCKTTYPRLIVSPRASIRGAQLLATYASETDGLAALAEAVLFKGFDRDSVATILRSCPLPAIVLRRKAA